MTDEQIVKALERCGNIGLCRDCPYYHFNSKRGLGCHNNLMLDALDLIKRQQAEIEELKKVGNKIDSLGLVATLIDQRERLARAKNEWERKVRAEAVREFAERLTDRICESIEKSMDNPNGADYFITDVYTDIDNIAREMTEGK